MGKRMERWTTESFLAKIYNKFPQIKIEQNFIFQSVDNKVSYECPHGMNKMLGWSLLKAKYCCRTAYTEILRSRMKGNRIPIETRREMVSKIFGDSLDVKSMIVDPNGDDYFLNLRCVKHNLVFGQWIHSLKNRIGCPECGNIRRNAAAVINIAKARKEGKSSFVSKEETKWLNSLNVPQRQIWLTDVKYCVDGFDPATNTVYLYHGKFWHGDPEKFAKDMIHPIRKNITMGELFENTKKWEKLIQDSGYTLVTKWK
jgi:hypothetical protein